MFELSDEDFYQVATAALDSLPEQFQSKLDNVEIVVEDYPTPQVRRRLPKRGLILGLYQGVPQKFRTSRYGLVPPDKITLFKKNIESLCSNREEIYQQVRKTLFHEIGHHFSFTDQELRDMGW
jgi:predicted Zn-dependent protease with MMP-like domain